MLRHKCYQHSYYLMGAKLKIFFPVAGQSPLLALNDHAGPTGTKAVDMPAGRTTAELRIG